MKKLALILLVICGLAIAGYLYVFHKPHRDIVGEEASLQLTAGSLVDQYSSDQQLANAEYLDEVLQVSGTVSEVGKDYIKLAEGVYANLSQAHSAEAVAEGDNISLKGRVVGFDELFKEVRLDNCILVSEE